MFCSVFDFSTTNLSYILANYTAQKEEEVVYSLSIWSPENDVSTNYVRIYLNFISHMQQYTDQCIIITLQDKPTSIVTWNLVLM